MRIPWYKPSHVLENLTERLDAIPDALTGLKPFSPFYDPSSTRVAQELYEAESRIALGHVETAREFLSLIDGIEHRVLGIRFQDIGQDGRRNYNAAARAPLLADNAVSSLELFQKRVRGIDSSIEAGEHPLSLLPRPMR